MSKSIITNELMVGILNYIKKENELTQKRIDMKLERKEFSRKTLAMGKSTFDLLKPLQEEKHNLLEYFIITLGKDNIKFLDSDIEHLIIEIEHRNKVIKILNKYI